MTSKRQAVQVVNEVMKAALPEGAPLSIREITSAVFQGKNRIVADVIMFDGLAAVLHLNRWSFGWSIGWDSMQGGDCYLDDDNLTWRRVVAQPDLFSAAA